MRRSCWIMSLAIWGMTCLPAAGLCAPEIPEASISPARSRPSQQQPQTFEAGGELIHILARTWEKVKDRVYAMGSVDVRYKNIRLFADRVEVEPKPRTYMPRATSSSNPPMRL